MHNFPNYGSVLQAYATQEKLREFSDDVEIVDYSGGDKMIGRGITGFWLTGFGSDPIKALVRLPVRLWQRKVYGGFIRRYLNITAKRYTTEEDFSKFPIHDGLYFTGSDQVWNPFFKETMPFFWGFLPDSARKFAFAASFGNHVEDRLSQEEITRIKNLVGKYEQISVREERGLRILTEQLGYQNAVQLVDPTLAMPPEFWRRLAPTPGIKGEYILVYKLGKSKSFEVAVKEVARRTGLPLVRFCSQSLGQLALRDGKKIVLPPVPRFISLIDNAKYIITDSFHGAAFAMNLNTELIVYRKEYDGGRITGFLSIVGQERRYISNCNDLSVLDLPTDFYCVNRALAQERKRVDDFLSEVFFDKDRDKNQTIEAVDTFLDLCRR